MAQARPAVPFLFAGLVGGCMLNPGNGQEVASADASVLFSGFLPTASGSVELRAAANPAGPFVAWSGSSTTANATPYFFSVPDGSGGSIQIYEWSLDAVIPSALWGQETGADGCDVNATYVRGLTGPYNLYSFDAPSPTYPGGLGCLVGEILDGEGILDALNTCRSASSPVVRLEAPADTVFVGDVVIASQAEADAFACVNTIDGDLTVSPTSPTTVDLPALSTVTGSVSLSLPVEGPPAGPFQELRCGGALPVTVQSVITRVHLPELTQVDGDIDIDAPSTGVGTTFGERIELDLDALTDLGGDLHIGFETAAVSPCGLSSLATMDGDLSLSFANGDVGGGSMLPSLADVGGDVAVSGGFTVLSLLRGLQHAGSVSLQDISNPSPVSTLDALATVDGSVYLNALPNLPLLTGLTDVGALVVEDIDATALSTIGSGAVDAGTLSLLANPLLSDLGTAASSNINLTPTASLIIGTGTAANPSLSAAEVCDFVAYQQSANGWTPQGAGFSCP